MGAAAAVEAVSDLPGIGQRVVSDLSHDVDGLSRTWTDTGGRQVGRVRAPQVPGRTWPDLKVRPKPDDGLSVDLVAVLLPTAVGALLTWIFSRGGAERRLMERATQDLELADRLRDRRQAARLREAARTAVDAALALRASGREFYSLLWTALGSTLFALFSLAYRAPAAARAAWQEPFWTAMAWLYAIIAIGLWIGFLAAFLRRRRAIRGT